MKSIFTFLSLLISLVALSQTNNIKIGYQEFPTTITGHTSDPSGNMYYSGNFKGQLTVPNQPTIQGAGLEDIFLVKTDSLGNQLFAKTFGSDGPDLPKTDCLAYDGNNLFMAVKITNPVSFDLINIVPYQNVRTGYTNCIIRFDTAGKVKWVNKTSLDIGKIYAGANMIHVIGQVETDTLQYNNQIILTSAKNQMVHLMLDSNGNVINYKQIVARKSNHQFQAPLFLSSYSHGSLSMLIGVYGDSSFSFGDKKIILPDTTDNYYVLIKTDTSYKNVSYKVLNRTYVNFLGPNGGLTLNLSKKDSTYLIITAGNSSNINYDGLTFQPFQNNILVVLDSNLIAKRVVKLGNPFFGYSNVSDGTKLLFQTINIADNKLLITGYFKGNNEAPVSQTVKQDTSINILPNFNTTVDLNGPTKRFLLSSSYDFSNPSLTWTGDNTEYEAQYFHYSFSHVVNDSKLVSVLDEDNVWNPYIFDSRSNTLISGKSVKNADRPDNIKFVEYLPDGSRIIMGTASGKTSLDTTSVGIKSNKNRADIFIAMIGSNGQTKWYKRFFSTLIAGNAMKMIVKDGITYFLANYILSSNLDNYIFVDQKAYSLKKNVTEGSLLGRIDSIGNVTVLNLDNNLKLFAFEDFNFCSNGDLAIITSVDIDSYSPLFPQVYGNYLFRLNPQTKVVNTARKITFTPFSLQPQHIEIDSFDNIYLSVPINVSSNSPFTTINLHDGNKYSDTIQYQNNPDSEHGAFGILKMSWDKFKWFKHSSGPNGFGLSIIAPEIFSINNKIIFQNVPTPQFINGQIDTTGQPFYWDKKLITPSMNLNNQYFFRMDTSGNIESQKRIPNFLVRNIKKKLNGQLMVSGSLSGTSTIDTIAVNYMGQTDALSFIIDSSFKATRSYRLATPFTEYMNDMDILNDSLLSFAYSAQTIPSLFLNKAQGQITDIAPDAYISSAVFKNTSPLALQLLSFNAVRNENIVNLNWSVEKDAVGDKYIIQRSDNGGIFHDLEIINSINNSSYQVYNAKDVLKTPGKYYYRIQIKTIDGRINFSKTVGINFPGRPTIFFYDTDCKLLHIIRNSNLNYARRILNVSGQIIYPIQNISGSEIINVSSLKPGEYIIQIYDNEAGLQGYKFIK